MTPATSTGSQLSAAQRLGATRLLVLDFDGVLTDNTVYVSQDGTESVRCWRGDGLGLSQLRAAGIETWVLSTETNPVVAARCRKLDIPCVQGLADKGAALRGLWSDGIADPETTCYVGNDINDIGCLTAVGLPVVVGDAHPTVVPLAVYVTTAHGGRGAVREVCDLIMHGRDEDVHVAGCSQ